MYFLTLASFFEVMSGPAQHHKVVNIFAASKAAAYS
jgi:hypothetical protein